MFLFIYYSPTYILLVLLLALILDGLVGDPDWFYRRFPHAVVFMGMALNFLERNFNNHAEDSHGWSIIKGGLCLLLYLLLFTGLSFLVFLIDDLIIRFCVEVIICFMLLAQRSLYIHVRLVRDSLGVGDLSGARLALSFLVTRDVERLDISGVSRSAIESLSENFSDSVVVPIFWFMSFGLLGLVFYKAVNTGDSMWGYRSERYLYFGRFAARLDDASCYVGSRLSVLVIFLASLFVRGCDAIGSLRVSIFSSWEHDSVNAGYPESAFAGSLGVSLGGERYYAGVGIKDGWIGIGRKDLTHEDIDLSLKLYRFCCIVILIIVVILYLLFWFCGG